MGENFGMDTVWLQFMRSGHRCECASLGCSVGHLGRCQPPFVLMSVLRQTN